MSRDSRRNNDYFICAHCGARVRDDADFCPACGASEDSGWTAGDDDDDQQLDYQEDEDDFDYDDFLRREFPEHAEPDVRPQWRRALLVAVVLLLCLAFLLMTVMRY
jgi:hypothetical protein